MQTRRFLAVASFGCVLTHPCPCSAGSMPPHVVRSVFVDSISTASFAFDGMSREAGELLSRVGVETAWRKAGGGTASAGTEEILLILLHRPAGALPRATLGAVVKSSGSSRAAWLYFDTIADALGIGSRDPEDWTEAQRIDFARALGRVVAHELIHILLPDLPHSRAGLMRATTAKRDLITTGAAFDSDVKNALEAAHAGGSLPPSVLHPPDSVPGGATLIAW